MRIQQTIPWFQRFNSIGKNWNVPAQDRSPFCIFNIMIEISQNSELMYTFLDGNHFHIFLKDYQIKCSQHVKKH